MAKSLSLEWFLRYKGLRNPDAMTGNSLLNLSALLMKQSQDLKQLNLSFG